MEGKTGNHCPRCLPAVPLDTNDGQRVLAHIGAHILNDQGLDHSSELCGLCLQPLPLCQIYLTKTKGSKRGIKVNQELLKECLMKTNFLYHVAAKSTPSSLCSNVPIVCPLCPQTDPAVWMYSLKLHFQDKHKSVSFPNYAHFWHITEFEKSEMKKIWKKWAVVSTKCVKKGKFPPLVISKSHCTKIPLNLRYFSSIF